MREALAKESSALRRRVSAALDRIGVLLAETALAPKAQGDLNPGGVAAFCT